MLTVLIVFFENWFPTVPLQSALVSSTMQNEHRVLSATASLSRSICASRFHSVHV